MPVTTFLVYFVLLIVASVSLLFGCVQLVANFHPYNNVIYPSQMLLNDQGKDETSFENVCKSFKIPSPVTIIIDEVVAYAPSQANYSLPKHASQIRVEVAHGQEQLRKDGQMGILSNDSESLNSHSSNSGGLELNEIRSAATLQSDSVITVSPISGQTTYNSTSLSSSGVFSPPNLSSDQHSDPNND